MITKESFKKLMTQLVELKKLSDDVEEAFRKINHEFYSPNLFSAWEDLSVKAIVEAVDGDKEDWISYFIYEQDMKPMKKGSITAKDGSDIPLRNLDDLYNLVTGEYAK